MLFNYQNRANNLITGQNLLYNTSSTGYNNINLIDKKNLYGEQSSKDKSQPEPGTKLHIMNLPVLLMKMILLNYLKLLVK